MNFKDFLQSREQLILRWDEGSEDGVYFTNPAKGVFQDGVRYIPDADNGVDVEGRTFYISDDCTGMFIYLDEFYIEMLEHKYMLTIENQSYVDSCLKNLERILFDWANDD